MIEYERKLINFFIDGIPARYMIALSHIAFPQ